MTLSPRNARQCSRPPLRPGRSGRRRCGRALAAALALAPALLAGVGLAGPTGATATRRLADAAGVAALPAAAGRLESGLPASLAGALAERCVPLRRDGSPGLQRERLLGRPAPASLRAVVLLCDFADSLLLGRWGNVPGEFPPPRQSDFYYAAHDSLFFVHQFLDVADYFAAASGGRFELRVDVVGRVANLPRPMGWYGDHPEEGEQSVLLAADAVAALDPYVDFAPQGAPYDAVILVHAGAGEETDILQDSPEQIYSTYIGPEDFAAAVEDSVLAQAGLPTDDLDAEGRPVTARHVLVLPETEYQDAYAGFGGRFGSLGVYCFEVGLRLGMLSLSDFTPPGRPDSQGVGEFDLMGYGLFVASGYLPCHPSAFNKLLMGWLDPYSVDPAAGAAWRLRPVETAGGDLLAARVEIGPREYWLLEYRLQDPDGNGIFSFPGDLNGNNVPDFYDADSGFGNGVPTGLFDPATDVKERLSGAEFDFFMSERQGEIDGVRTVIKGNGSGLYIWHVDEGVVADVIDAETNLFNADPGHKAVDLEEADGIQDLDSRQASDFMLGSERDAFRGEGNDAFGPATNPDTRTAGNAWTGVWIDLISDVVDTVLVTPGSPTGTTVVYADAMSFRCRREGAAAGGPQLVRDLALDGPAGVDLRGSHLLAVDLDGEDGGAAEVVAGDAAGRVLAFRADLTEYRDGDADPATSGVLASGVDAEGAPASWTGPPAAGDLDEDGRPEIVLTAGDGLYAFNGEDGSEVADGDLAPASRGRLCALASCALPPVLLPLPGAPPGYAPERAVVACVVETAGGRSRLRFLTGAGADLAPPVDLGPVVVPAPPLLVGDLLLAAVADTAAGTGSLLAITWSASSPPLVAAAIDLAGRPGPLGAVAAAGLASDPQGWVAVVDAEGGVELVRWRGETFQPGVKWSGHRPVTTPLAFDLAHGESGRLALGSPEGFPLTGWPVAPRPEVDFPDAARAPSPLAIPWTGGDNDPGSARAHLFQSRDGRLFLYDGRGRLQTGWPVGGPSEAAGTPLAADLDGDGTMDLVAAGTFARVVGRSAESGELQVRPVSRLAVWSLGPAGVASGWPMWRANPWRTPDPRWADVEEPLAGAGLLRPGSAICYPSPLRTGPLRVRAETLADCTVRVFLYDLAGEEVAVSPPVPVRAGQPVEVALPLEGAAAGMYVCRLVADGAAGGRQTSVLAVAVVR